MRLIVPQNQCILAFFPRLIAHPNNACSNLYAQHVKIVVVNTLIAFHVSPSPSLRLFGLSDHYEFAPRAFFLQLLAAARFSGIHRYL